VLDTLDPASRGLLLDLVAQANSRGIVKNIDGQIGAVRYALDDLQEMDLIERLNESTLQVKLSLEERAQLSHAARNAPVPLAPSQLRADSSRNTGRGSDGSSNACGVDSPTSGARVKSNRKVLQRRAGRGLENTPVALWRGSHLAAYFVREIGESAVLKRIALGPGPYNIGALSGSMNGWLRDGVSSEEIKSMIDLLATDLARYVNQRIPLWRVFLARRQHLLQEARRIEQERAQESRDKDDWVLASSDDNLNHDSTYWEL
jgi:hypothetical protein